MSHPDRDPSGNTITKPEFNLYYALRDLRYFFVPAKETHGVETRSAAPTAIRPDHEEAADGVPPAGWTGKTYFHCSTRKTLWNLVAAQKGYDQERAGDHGQ